MNGTIDVPEEAWAIIDAMLEADETKLYAWLGESLDTEETLHPYPGVLPSDTVAKGFNFIGDRVYSREGGQMPERPTAIFIPLGPRIEKGKKFLEENIKKLHQKICVDMDACHWEKEILEDSKELFTLLLPTVGTVLGMAIPATVFTVTIIMMKWGIRSFCDCAKKKDN